MIKKKKKKDNPIKFVNYSHPVLYVFHHRLLSNKYRIGITHGKQTFTKINTNSIK
jgi:hypothetical protein